MAKKADTKVTKKRISPLPLTVMVIGGFVFGLSINSAFQNTSATVSLFVGAGILLLGTWMAQQKNSLMIQKAAALCLLLDLLGAIGFYWLYRSLSTNRPDFTTSLGYMGLYAIAVAGYCYLAWHYTVGKTQKSA